MLEQPQIATGLGFRNGEKRLLSDVNLTLKQNGITVLMGPNGAGKSLLLRLLHGLLDPTEGTVSWGADNRQAMVFQAPVLLRRSVSANIDFALAVNGNKDPSFRDQLLDKVGLGTKANDPARRLSGGEQQRLAIARALATRPKVLFLDEPTASLDPASTEAIEILVKDITAQGVKSLFVTHDVGQGHRLADDVVFLDSGRVVEHRIAKDFFETPQSAQARAYLRGQFYSSGVPAE